MHEYVGVFVCAHRTVMYVPSTLIPTSAFGQLINVIQLMSLIHNLMMNICGVKNMGVREKVRLIIRGQHEGSL